MKTIERLLEQLMDLHVTILTENVHVTCCMLHVACHMLHVTCYMWACDSDKFMLHVIFGCVTFYMTKKFAPILCLI